MHGIAICAFYSAPFFEQEIIHNSKSVPIHGYHAACGSVIKLLLQETYDLAIVPSSSSSYRKTNAFHHQKKSK